MTPNVKESLDLISEALPNADTRIWALFSGGHDSATMTHIVSHHPNFAGVIHIDTGTGLLETEQYVKQICQRYEWQLVIKKPWTTYEQLIVKYGFPGAGHHPLMYNMLKGRPLRVAKSFVANKLPILFSGGMRQLESDRRMGNAEPYHKDGEGYWASPIYNWSAENCMDYMSEEKIPRNPVKDILHFSGECFCGAFAGPHEYRDLQEWFPYQANRIDGWQRLVTVAKEIGGKIKAKHCKWGHGERTPDEQPELFPMCQYCPVARGVEMTDR